MLLFNIIFNIIVQSDKNFNTSNVTIQQMTQTLKHVQCYDFNTSNVTIQLDVQEEINNKIEFQYI